jgi:hypothetical protein
MRPYLEKKKKIMKQGALNSNPSDAQMTLAGISGAQGS